MANKLGMHGAAGEEEGNAAQAAEQDARHAADAAAPEGRGRPARLFIIRENSEIPPKRNAAVCKSNFPYTSFA